MNLKKLLFVVLLVTGLVSPRFGEARNMTSYWGYTRYPHYIKFKDLSDAPGGDHDSFDHVMKLGPMCSFDGVTWYGYKWGWVYRRDDGTVYEYHYQISLFGQKLIDKKRYIVDAKDIYLGTNLSSANWNPYKRISKVNWQFGDTIDQYLNMNNVENEGTECNYSPSLPQDRHDAWVLAGSMRSLTLAFKDGSTKEWSGPILLVEEHELFHNVKISYYLKYKYGIVAFKMITTDNGYVFLSVGAY